MENKNLINGAWDWNNINEDRWVTPAPVVYPLLQAAHFTSKDESRNISRGFIGGLFNDDKRF